MKFDRKILFIAFGILLLLVSASSAKTITVPDSMLKSYKNISYGNVKINLTMDDYNEIGPDSNPYSKHHYLGILKNSNGFGITIKFTNGSIAFNNKIVQKLQGHEIYPISSYVKFNRTDEYNVTRQFWNITFDDTIYDSTTAKSFRLAANTQYPFVYIVKTGRYLEDSYNITYNVSGNLVTLDPTVSACGTLSTANATYTLSRNISSSGHCLILGANNIIIDGAGYTISHYGAFNSSTFGVHINGYDNTTVKHITIDGYGTGVKGGGGAADDMMAGLTLQNITVKNGVAGYEDGYQGSNAVKVYNSTFQNMSLRAISGDWVGAIQHEITQNKILDSRCGIKFINRSGINVKIWDNLVNASDGVCETFSLESYSGSFTMNIAPVPGTNIIGGSKISGNAWGSLNGTGFSQTCSGPDVNGNCNNAYVIPVGTGTTITDYKPLYMPYVTAAIALNSPANNTNFSSSSITLNWTPSGFSSNPTCNVTRVNGGTVTLFSGTCTNGASCTTTNITSDALYNWSVYCYYGSENATSEIWTFRVDTTAPITTANAVKNDSSSYTFNTWAKTSYVNVSLSCSDGGIGCDKTLYCTDTSDTCTPTTQYSSAVQVSTQGVSYFRYKSNDTLNNIETAQSQTVKIDTTAPAITIQSPANTTYAATSVELNFTASDSGSGLNSCWYSLDGGSNITLSSCANASLNSLSEGSHNVRVYANDSMGMINSSVVYFSITLLSVSAWETSSLIADNATQEIWANVTVLGGYNTTSVTAFLTYANGTSENASMWISNGTVQNATWKTNIVMPAIDGMVNYSVEVLTDGNLSANSSMGNFTIDAVVPTINSFYSSSSDFLVPGTVSIYCNFTDTYPLAASVIFDNITYAPTNITATLWKADINVSSSGNHTTYCIAEDQVNHSMESSALTIRTTSYEIYSTRDFVDVSIGPTIAADANYSSAFIVQLDMKATGTAQNVKVPISYEIKDDAGITYVEVTDAVGTLVTFSNYTSGGKQYVAFNTSTFSGPANLTYFINYSEKQFNVKYWTEGNYRYLNVTRNFSVFNPANYILFNVSPTQAWDPLARHIMLEVYVDGQWVPIGSNYCQEDDFAAYDLYYILTFDQDATGNKRKMSIKYNLARATEYLMRITVVDGAEKNCVGNQASGGSGGGGGSTYSTAALNESVSASASIGKEKLDMFLEQIGGFFKYQFYKFNLGGREYGLSNAFALVLVLLTYVGYNSYHVYIKKNGKLGYGSVVALICAIGIFVIYLPYLW